MNPRSKVVLVTGASSGIGAAAARRLAGRGFTVWATARDPAALAALRAAGCATRRLDVTDEASMVDAVRAIEARDGPIGGLVNNAGYSLSGALEMLPLADVRRQFETNVFGLLRLTQLVLPGMRAAGGGRIVNVSSMGGRLTFPGGGAYHATKHALEALSDALRFEVKGFGIDVVVVQPGLIRSGFAAAAVARIGGGERRDPYAAFDRAVAKATTSAYVRGPLARLGGEPEAVAIAIEKALTAATPKTRYRVTPSAHLLMSLRALLPDRIWDRLVGGGFPRPGAS